MLLLRVSCLVCIPSLKFVWAFPFRRHDPLSISSLVGLVILTFDLESGRSIARGVSNLPTNFVSS